MSNRRFFTLLVLAYAIAMVVGFFWLNNIAVVYHPQPSGPPIGHEAPPIIHEIPPK